MNEDDLLALHLRPAEAGRLATLARTRAFGDAIAIVPAPRHEPPAAAAIVRGDVVVTCDAWPDPATVQPGDRVVVQVDADDGARRRFVRWLSLAAKSLPEGTAIAPLSREPAGLHRLFCIAAARLRLPERVRVEVRHDLVGIRLAQVALGFGADTLAGPLQPERKLPVAGVPRPNEATRTGLHHLVLQTGARPLVRVEGPRVPSSAVAAHAAPAEPAPTLGTHRGSVP